MSEPKTDQGKISPEILDEIVRGSNMHQNVHQVIITITEDKAYRCINEHKNLLEQEKAWIAPLGIFLTLVLALITSDFRQALFLNADVWKAAFLISAAVTLIWLIRTVPAIFRKRKTTIDNLLEELKKVSGQPIAADSKPLTRNSMQPQPQPSFAVPAKSSGSKWNEIRSKIQPELLNEIRNDLRNNPTQREFMILSNPNIGVFAEFKGQKLVAYYQTNFTNLNSQIAILEKHGCVRRIQSETPNKPAKYIFDEQFVDAILDELV
ncbi:hypothetical protein L0244_03395 [bacterium]|nr:hypothetical protein [bacterium]